MIKVPYRKQEFWFSCLPACIRMLLEFYGIAMDEKVLRKSFKTTTEGGTSWPDVVNGLREMGIELAYLKNQDLDKLKDLIDQNIPAVVSVDTRKLGDFAHRQHTVVVIGINDDYVTVHDPEKGPDTQLKISQFIDAWKVRLYRIGYIVRK